MSTKATLEKAFSLLSKHGYIQKTLKTASYVNGPAGTLLRHNITEAWWEKMVVKPEAVFPIHGKDIDPLHDYFPTIIQLLNKSTPFALTKISQRKPKDVPSDLIPLLNDKEDTRLEYLHFCLPSTASQAFDDLVHVRSSWWKQYSYNSFLFTQSSLKEEQTRKLHLQYMFPWGPETIETIYTEDSEVVADIEQTSGIDCQVKNGEKNLLPSVIRCSMSLELAMVVFLMNAISEPSPDNQKQHTQQKLHLHASLAPFKVALTSTGEKVRPLHEVVTYLNRELRKAGLQILDTKDTYTPTSDQIIMYDEMGIPFTILINDNTIDTGTVQLRNRETQIFETVAIGKVTDYIKRHVTYQPPS